MVKTNFRFRLFLIMIVFALVISFAIAMIDYLRMKEQAINDNQLQVKQTEEILEYSLKTIEKAYFLFDKETASIMEVNTSYLLNEYEENPNFEDWDFQALKDLLNIDIYIINEANVITHGSLQTDIGLDFSVCCEVFNETLDERRDSGGFFTDGIDIEQKTGEIKRYSYMATSDKKYIIELSYSLQNGEIFKEFSFLNVIEELVQNHPSINEINVLNIEGHSLGEPAEKLTGKRQKAFEETYESKQTTELKDRLDNESIIYRYVHYRSDFDTGVTKNKVLEIVYNEYELQSILSEYRKSFMIQLSIILAITIIISLIISSWIAKLIHLAFHDGLTGLKNRAAFNDVLKKQLKDNNGITGLLMIDLDNFKLVNDAFGHKQGDDLLELVAETIQTVAHKKDHTFRMGGDEFSVMMPVTSKQKAEKMAKDILVVLEATFYQKRKLKGLNISASIGISLAPEHSNDPEELYKQADIALYVSKEKGKGQYYTFKGYRYRGNKC